MSDWLLTLMSALRWRPGWILGNTQLDTLAAHIEGYRRAHDQLGHPVDDGDLAAFGHWLAERTSTEQGWYSACRFLNADVPEVVSLYEQFAASQGRALLDPADALHAWLGEP